MAFAALTWFITWAHAWGFVLEWMVLVGLAFLLTHVAKAWPS